MEPWAKGVPWMLVLAALVGGWAHGEPAELAQVRSKYPLKSARTIFTDADIRQARENMEAYPAAVALAEKLIGRAGKWLEWTDEDLRALIPDATVPRAFNVGTEGCPKCGKAIYEKGGTYPWIIDPAVPFKVRCPICDGLFPDNDFGAYYASGYEDKAFLEGDYADDGWGWVGPNGQRYWLVAYANHWTLHNHVFPAMLYLGWAYVLTEDPAFAHKAAVLLDRVAEVYPDLDYHNQSRYGALTELQGGHYCGKFLNHIWATGNLTTFAKTYDAVWDTIDGDTELQALTERSGLEIREHFEANVLEGGIQAVFDGEIAGNFGMHQRALVYATLSRQHGPTEEWLDSIFSKTNCKPLEQGVDYALYNLVYRDGVPFETSPGYNASWVSNLTTIADALKKTDRDLYRLPKIKRMHDATLEVVNAGRFTPSLGDSGDVYGGLVIVRPALQSAYRAYGDPRYLAHLIDLGVTGDASFQDTDALFVPPIEGEAPPLPTPRSRLLDGYGMAILNNPDDSVSLSLYYGFKGGHGHYDRLHFDLFANGQAMMPDLGYPDFMNAYVSGIYTWSKNTICHNTVTVDASKQPENLPGTVHLFADGPFARVLSVDGAGTYPQCSDYSRQLFMVDAGPGQSYVVDVFAVEGGHQHDFSLHGPPGSVSLLEGTWEAQEGGTMAGPDVPVGEIYDDPVLGAPDYDGVYWGYQGSGFQHLFNVQRLAEGLCLTEYTHERENAAKLRIRQLTSPNMEVFTSDAQVSPVKHKQLVKYVIARHTGEKEGLRSTFASVLEPFSGEPIIADARREDFPWGTCVAVERAGGGTDVIIANEPGAEASVERWSITTDASAAVVAVDADGTVERVFFAGGTYLTAGDQRFAAAPVAGRIIAVEPETQTIRVRLDGQPERFRAEDLVERVAHFQGALRKTSHPIQAAALDGKDLVLATGDDLFIGRVHVTDVEANALRTDTPMMFAPIYRGAWLADAACKAFFPIQEAAAPGDEPGSVTLTFPLPEDQPFRAGQNAWIVNVGPGDRLVVPGVCSWVAEGT